MSTLTTSDLDAEQLHEYAVQMILAVSPRRLPQILDFLQTLVRDDLLLTENTCQDLLENALDIVRIKRDMDKRLSKFRNGKKPSPSTTDTRRSFRDYEEKPIVNMADLTQEILKLCKECFVWSASFDDIPLKDIALVDLNEPNLRLDDLYDARQKLSDEIMIMLAGHDVFSNLKYVFDEVSIQDIIDECAYHLCMYDRTRIDTLAISVRRAAITAGHFTFASAYRERKLVDLLGTRPRRSFWAKSEPPVDTVAKILTRVKRVIEQYGGLNPEWPCLHIKESSITIQHLIDDAELALRGVKHADVDNNEPYEIEDHEDEN